MNTVKTTCPYCGVGCGVVAHADGAVHGDPAHPANFGRLCSKGSALGETLGDEGRLLRPRIAGRDAHWEEALDLVAERFRRTIAEHGPEAIAFYASGQFLTEDYYVANKLMKGFIGSGNIDTNSRLCMASSVAGHIRAFGEDVVPGIYEDWDEADLVVLVGSNTAWCHPILYQRLVAARARRGTRVVVIDPRRTATCEIADLHLPLAAGTDVALFDGLLAHLAERGGFDMGFVDRHTSGIAGALEAAGCSAGDVERVASITGLAQADIATFYDWFLGTERTMTIFSQGVNQSSAGSDKVNAIINCHLATGRIGRPGMGPFSITGQPNAMGGREVGGLANQLAAHMSFDRPADIDRIRRFWNAPSMTERPGLKAVDMFDAMLDGRIKAIWIMATNPAASMPRADRVRQALERCPFVVVSDCWDTDTTARAHVVLPAASWGEKEGTVTNSERRISRQRPFRNAPGESRPDWWMLTEVARRMGWSDAFPYRGPADIFREHAALSAFENDGRRVFDIGALADITEEAYRALGPVRWPLPAGESDPANGRLFGDGIFATEDGRARFVPTRYRPPAAAPDRKRPFVLNTGRVRDQWHTMTRTGRSPRLMSHQDEPYLDLHPRDAVRLGLAPGDLVRVETAHGSAVLRARPNEGQKPGETFAPMHWTDRFGSSGPVDRLVTAAVDPVSGQPELKATPARLAPMPTLWRGLLLSETDEIPRGDFYCSRIPVATGHAFEMRGWSPLPDPGAMSVWARERLGGAADADLVDPQRGIYRFARFAGGRLQSCLFVTQRANWPLPDRASIAPLIGKVLDEEARDRLFAIDESACAAPPKRSRTVCSCFSVSVAEIERAIAAGRLSTVAEIGATLRCGTNCGSCIPELEEILRDARVAA
jgi:assimilatory nitrate reductase catalytic subunit